MLEQLFRELTKVYISDDLRREELWEELKRYYSQQRRYYHTFEHLSELYQHLEKVKTKIDDWDSILFALFYHDIIYKITRKDNEAKSAALAKDRLEVIGFPIHKIKRCTDHIIATKTHVLCDDSDTNLFTDADLAILGSNWERYKIYVHQVRKEYSIYPDLMYKPGRRKVLHHFLQMNRIYKTVHFYEAFEVSARDNMRKELKELA